jgi:hypothetical protein
MQTVSDSKIAAVSRNPQAREIHELTYYKHSTGASEADIWRAIERVGANRLKVERELRRSGSMTVRDSAA